MSKLLRAVVVKDRVSLKAKKSLIIHSKTFASRQGTSKKGLILNNNTGPFIREIK